MMTLRRFIVALFAVAAFGAAFAQPAALPAGVRRVPPERLGNYWLLIPESAQANVPNSGYGLDAPTCVAVSYVVEKNGTTSHVKLERAVPQGPLAKVALNVVKGMRFAPTAQNAGKDSVATWVVMPFNVPDAASTKPADKALRERVLAPCQPADSAAAAK